MSERETELKFVHFNEDYYTLQYREKNFVPKEIEPSSFFGRLNRLIFGKKYTKNKWRTLYHFCYGWQNEWIHKGFHPSGWCQEYLVRYKEIEETKKKFNTIEKINEFIDKSNKHYNKMVEIYEEETKQYKEVIY